MDLDHSLPVSFRRQSAASCPCGKLLDALVHDNLRKLRLHVSPLGEKKFFGDRNGSCDPDRRDRAHSFLQSH